MAMTLQLQQKPLLPSHGLYLLHWCLLQAPVSVSDALLIALRYDHLSRLPPSVFPVLVLLLPLSSLCVLLPNRPISAAIVGTFTMILGNLLRNCLTITMSCVWSSKAQIQGI
uniref:Uncharacterized protein n=1 Tax=Chenopodium quinoa TaxID=63459 RepID=A0A803NCN8_CHEQI